MVSAIWHMMGVVEQPERKQTISKSWYKMHNLELLGMPEDFRTIDSMSSCGSCPEPILHSSWGGFLGFLLFPWVKSVPGAVLVVCLSCRFWENELQTNGRAGKITCGLLLHICPAALALLFFLHWDSKSWLQTLLSCDSFLKNFWTGALTLC